jgi:ATP-dependent Lon protease
MSEIGELMNNIAFFMGESGEDFFPVISADDEKHINSERVPKELPIITLRNAVLYPGSIMPITIGRDKSLKLINDVSKTTNIVGVIAQRDANVEDPGFDDLFEIGTVGKIIKTLQMPDHTKMVVLQGRNRFRVIEPVTTEPYHIARVQKIKPVLEPVENTEFAASIELIKNYAKKLIKQSANIPDEASMALENIQSPVYLLYFISTSLNLPIDKKQRILESDDPIEIANIVLEKLASEIQILEIKEKIEERVKSDIDKQQKDYFLNVQLKAIQDELGVSTNEQELKDLYEKAQNKKWSEEVAELFDREFKKLQRMNPAAAEYSVQLNYLELLVNLPWNEYTTDNYDLKRARKVLDEDHYGLEKVKDRIIEFLAVTKLNGNMRSPILCLVGPPGVGKTSLGKSIARALERKYIRISLGGLHDEAEIRGHRKTYVGAMPGRIIQSLRKVQSSNPVFMLDEIDKVGTLSIQGDPQAALLEVLDPEQNTHFYDNYLETEYDLSKVMFIATANNTASINPALLDRMEIIELHGYVLEEKLEIAKRFLVPKQLEENGMAKSGLKFSEKSLKEIIDNYTRESGVRALEKRIAKIIRNKAVDYASNKLKKTTLSADDIREILGVPIFKREKALNEPMVGVVLGLAWTPVGGEILFIEASTHKGDGRLSMTGNLGDVMKESATLAFEFIKANAKLLNIDEDFYQKINIHIHVPEGAIPKDGPSAGVTMLTAMTSVLLNKPVRNDIAMTGEITLRGKVLPVGGIKEKILAASRAGIKNIILPADNMAEFYDIEKHYTKDLHPIFVENMIDVLKEVIVNN